MTDVANYPSPETIWGHIQIALDRDLGGVRDTFDHNGRDSKVIQLGTGHKHISGWINYDYPTFNADGAGSDELGIPIRPWRCIPAEDNSVGAIACYNTLDHLTPEQVVRVMKDVQRVLVVGGTFTSVVPHYSSQLANECLMHKSRWAVDTWRNLFSERQYDGKVDGRNFKWRFTIDVNFIFGLTERNTFLVTRLIRTD